MVDNKLVRLTRLGLVKPPKEKGEVSKSATSADLTDNQRLLNKAMQYWSSFDAARKKRRRCRDYEAGRQWNDLVYNGHKWVIEKDHIQAQGQVPLINNIFGSIINNILGQYRSNRTKTRAILRQQAKGNEEEVIANAIDAIHDINNIEELYAKQVREKILAGVNIMKLSYGYFRERDRNDIKYNCVDFDRAFFNPDVRDVRLTDINFIGELHDYTINDILAEKKYCKSPTDEAKIRQWYAGCTRDSIITQRALSTEQNDAIDFLLPTDSSYCRVIEVWELRLAKVLDCHDWMKGEYYTLDPKEKPLVEAENRTRLQQVKDYNSHVADPAQQLDESNTPIIEYYYRNEQYWHVKHLTPNGQCLWEAEEPFEHQEHPYVVSMGTFIDGEVYGLAYSWIDQQRGINRNAILMEMLIGTSAKNVFIIPKSAVGDKMPEEIASEITRLGNVFIYKAKPGEPAPQFVSTNGTNIGIKEALSLYLEGIKSVSGVYGAIQGQAPTAGTPASRYEAEAQNSTLNLLNFFSEFASFKERCDRKALKLMYQFYKDKQMIPVVGSRDISTVEWDPEVIRDVDADVKVIQSQETPTYRSMVSQQVFDFVQKGLLPIEVGLQSSPEAWAKTALDNLEKWKEAQAQAQTGQEVPPEMADQMMGALQEGAAGADPQKMEALQAMMAQQ